MIYLEKNFKNNNLLGLEIDEYFKNLDEFFALLVDREDPIFACLKWTFEFRLSSRKLKE